MKKKSYQYWRYHLLWVVAFLFGGGVTELKAQFPASDPCSAAVTSLSTLTTANSINQPFNVLSGFSGSVAGVAVPGTSCTGSGVNILATERDAFVRVRAEVTGPLVISYATTTNTANIALAVYTGICGSGMLLQQCSDRFGAGITETVTINAILNAEYVIRVIDRTSAGGVSMNGFLSVYNGPRDNGDLCTDAIDISVGSCDIPFNVNGTFYNNEKSLTHTGCTNGQDGWLKFTLGNNRKVRVTYASDNKSATLAVYGGAGVTCGTITTTPVACNTSGGAGASAFVEITAGVGVETYFVRIENAQDNLTMNGSFCLTELLARNDCGTASLAFTSDNVSVGKGDCNVRFDVTSGGANTDANFLNCAGGATPGNGNTVNPDAWTVYNATENALIRVEYTSTNGIVPNIYIYDAGAVISGSFCTPAAPINALPGCAVAGGGPAQSAEFVAVSGRKYFIRIQSQTNSNMFGSLCLYQNIKKAEDNFFSASDYLIDGTDCGIQFNLLSAYNDEGGLNSTTISCPTPTNYFNDGWAKFNTGATPPTSITIECNNDNRDPSVSNDVILSVYRMPTLSLGSAGGSDCASATPIILNSSENITVGFGSATGPDLGLGGDCAGLPVTVNNATYGNSRWFTYTTVDNSPLAFAFESFGTDALIEVYSDCATFLFCSDGALGAGISTLDFATGGAGETYLIRVLNKSNSTNLTGKLSFYSYIDLTSAGSTPMTFVSCVDALVEGTESLVINNPVANSTYFVRVANKSLNSTNMTLCVRNDQIQPYDLCVNSKPVLVGDCELDFNVPTTFVLQQPLPKPSCLTSATLHRDGWMNFTATSNQTTIEYLNTTQDVALVIYRGSCTGLIEVGCANAVVGLGTEKVKINTVTGLQYFIRVINIQSNAIALNGDVCIYNTTERDICDDNDLVTKSAGECNIPYDVPQTFDNSDVLLRNFIVGDSGNNLFPVTETGGSLTQLVSSSCESGGEGTSVVFNNNNNNPDVTTPTSGIARTGIHDGWMRIIGNGNDMTLSYQNNEATSNPAFAIYTALKAVGPVTCGSGFDGAGLSDLATSRFGTNQYACANKVNTPSLQTESVTFKTNAGQIYLVRIINLADTDMTGRICISEGRQDYEDPCTVLTTPAGGPRTTTIGDCSIPMNVVSGINYCSDPGAVGAQGTNYAQATCSDCAVGDVWASVRRPFVCDPVTAGLVVSPSIANCNTAAIGVYGAGNGGAYFFNTTTNKCDCTVGTGATPVTIRTTYANNFTVQYDNRDGQLGTNVGDVKLAVYRVTAGFNCNDETTYNRVGCVDAVVKGIETINVTGLTMTHGAGGETYLIRIINKTAGKTAFGKLCTFYGTTLGDQNCPPNNDYGALEGEFAAISTPAGTYANNSPTLGVPNRPTQTIPNCVLPGGSNPASNGTDPIRSQVWMSFTIPNDAGYSAVTVQYSNLGITNAKNAAIAIYRFGSASFNNCNFLTGNCNTFVNPTNLPGIELVSCANNVFQGSESVTFSVTKDPNPACPTIYFVRVMNVHNETNPTAMPGFIRIFPYAVCNAGPELVIDGGFSGWPGLKNRGTNADNTTQTQAAFDGNQEDDFMFVPSVRTTDAYPNDLDMNVNSVNTGIARFATDYGFLRDRTSANLAATVANPFVLGNGAAGDTVTTGTRTNGSGELNVTGVSATNVVGTTYRNFFAQQYELNPEGYYLVRHTPWLVKGDWFGYGNGYSGYGGRTGGGRPVNSYCTTGAGTGQEPCVSVVRTPYPNTSGAFSTGIERPRQIPPASSANFMIVNGSYDPAGGLPPGKVWCQTIQRGGSSGIVGYYIFTVWVQNMISGGRNLDVPMMRMSVCDMEDAATGNIPNPRTLTAGADSRNTRLPGITDPSITPVVHIPRPPTNRLVAPRVAFSYGAAMSCNKTIANGYDADEPRDARLKVLGSSFLVNETPDKWVLIRCVYRAPKETTEMNICLENLSLTKNGNDFAIDDIGFRECLNADAATFDKLLKGDPCELTDNPKVIGPPLGAQVLDFKAKLAGDKVLLDWYVVRETDLQSYEIQRSVDGNNFYKVGEVDAKGTETGEASYNFTDHELPLGAKYIYYRLRYVDRKGYGSLGAIVQVSLEAFETFDLRLVPNPVDSETGTELRFNVPAGKAVIAVTDLTGNKLMENIVQVQNGENRIFLDTKGLTNGVYIVRLFQNGKAVSKKLVVK